MFYWIGLRENGRWEVFATDTRKDATPESTGYDEVEGPYDTRAEAEYWSLNTVY